ncbi:hypothetical protein [Legionella micdadei]|uniref:Thioesterase domain-containing protein n=1 Tax=Legionella micdadei TaxID=451 RepID=A0A098GCZ6_LEGMI|nr:hypothetical protein [Legionella micdadei]ARG98019.1 hypothetical protein B6N58_10300 [Legionella micdadei]ARH00815.1 hypothetical protein B6V88_10520 [Legionella micdadei]KTD30158.1 hypothetical protein Lmic_0339 [Legionella micdadei]NSL18467.1 hypothetical protein [Legionella micdadei]CEG60353.1 conserved protein of unknown function [Legionella micdadei]
MESRCHYRIGKSILYLCILLSNLYLTGCIDLAATQSLSKDKNYVFKSKARVFVMRGGLGGIFSTGMNQLQSTLERKYRIRTESTVWYKVDQLSKYIIKNYGTKELPGPIILAGHSLGANEQIKVAKNLAKANIPVDLLITIDAVSPLEVPPNVKHVLNIYKPSFVPMFSGLRVKAMDPKRTTIENLNVSTLKTVAVNHFTIDKNEEIQNLMVNRSLAAISNANSKTAS